MAEEEVTAQINFGMVLAVWKTNEIFSSFMKSWFRCKLPKKVCYLHVIY